MSELLLKAVIVISCLCAVGVAKFALHWKNDNPIEQVAEQVIKCQTGQDIDLSPEE